MGLRHCFYKLLTGNKMRVATMRVATMRQLVLFASLFFIASGLHAQQPSPRVLLDHYYNNEFRKDANGNLVPFHYLWEDTTNPGYSSLGDLFRLKGATLTELDSSALSLKDGNADVYILVDPDTDKETALPHYIGDHDADAIAGWVRAGGVLVLLANDSGNSEFTHLNQLSTRFGITFNQDCRNRVLNDRFEQGMIMTPDHDRVFGSSKKLFIKEYSSLSLQKPAKAVLRNGDHVVMAVSRFGKGKVVAMGDPWIYNEYFDHRRLPGSFQNKEGAEAWVTWLLSLSQKR